MGDACAKLYERMPLPEANFFGIVVSIQQRAGGNLSEALGNLSRVLRDRKKMKAKIQAMSMEAKASAVIIAALPFAVMILVYISSPNYIELLMDASDRPPDDGVLRGVDVDRRLRDEEDDQFRFLAHDPKSGHRFSDKVMRKRKSIVVEFLIEKLHDPKMMASVFAAIAAMATVITLAMPLLARNDLNTPHERRLGRAREDAPARARAARARRQGAAAPDAEAVHEAHRRPVQPQQMGWTGRGAREADPGRLPRQCALRDLPVLPAWSRRSSRFCVTSFYLFFVLQMDRPPTIKLGMALFAAFVGMQLPYLFLKNKIGKRQLSIRRAFPDALDLLLICVESGMSIEAAFRKVSQEIGSQSIPLAEELTLTTAELSYLQDRKVAYENLATPHRPGRRARRCASRCSSPSATARRSVRRCA